MFRLDCDSWLVPSVGLQSCSEGSESVLSSCWRAKFLTSVNIFCFNWAILGRRETLRRTNITSSSEDKWVRSMLSATAWTSRTFLSGSSPLKMVRAIISMWITWSVNTGLLVLLRKSNSSHSISGGAPGKARLSILEWDGHRTVDPVFSWFEIFLIVHWVKTTML